MSEIEIHELSAAYALDALDDQERAAFEAHYASCTVCRGDVGDFRATAAELARVTETPTTPALRQRVLTEVSMTRQLPPLSVAPVKPVAADLRRRRAITAALSCAAAVACFALGAAVFRGGANEFDSTVAAMLREPDVRVARLAGEGGANVQVLWTGRRTAVSGDGLARPPAGAVYELWLIDDEGAHPMGLLDPAHDGTVERVVEVGGRPAAWGITIEPEGGSAAPTLPILYGVEVTGTSS